MPGKETRYPFDTRLYGPPTAGLNAVVRRKVLWPFRELNTHRPARSLVTTLTEVSYHDNTRHQTPQDFDFTA